MPSCSFATFERRHCSGSLAFLALLALATGDYSSGCSWSALVEVTRELGASVADGLLLKDRRGLTDAHSARGLRTGVAFKAGDEIMKIPSKLMMTEAKGTKLAQASGALDDAPSAAAASLFSLASAVLSLEQEVESGGGGPGFNGMVDGDSDGARLAKAWLLCLNDPTEWSAAFFSKPQLEATAVSIRSHDVKAVAWAIEQLTEQGVPSAGAQLAVHLALSRANRATDTTGTAMLVIAPLMDLMNHDADPNVRVDFSSPDCSVIAERDIEAGEELTHRYIWGGSKMSWISRYGFVPVYKVPDAILYSGASSDSAVADGLRSLHCPEYLINEGLLLLFATDVMGLGEKQLDCLELRRHLKLGLTPSAARDIIIETSSRNSAADTDTVEACKSFAKKYHTRKALKAFGRLRKKASDKPSDKRLQVLVKALSAEVEAIARCAAGSSEAAAMKQPRADL